MAEMKFMKCTTEYSLEYRWTEDILEELKIEPVKEEISTAHTEMVKMCRQDERH